MAFSTKRVYLSAGVNAAFSDVAHSQPTTPTGSLGDVDVREQVTLEITASTDVNSNKVTAFNALIGTSIVSAVDAFIAASSPGLGVDTTTHTVSYNAQVVNITRGTNGLKSDILLPAANDAFKITVDLRVYLS